MAQTPEQIAAQQATQDAIDAVKQEDRSSIEITALRVIKYRAKDGEPTCALSFSNRHVCIFLGSSHFGQTSICLYPDCHKDRLKTRSVFGFDVGLGWLQPHKNCPLWEEKKGTLMIPDYDSYADQMWDAANREEMVPASELRAAQEDISELRSIIENRDKTTAWTLKLLDALQVPDKPQNRDTPEEQVLFRLLGKAFPNAKVCDEDLLKQVREMCLKIQITQAWRA